MYNRRACRELGSGPLATGPPVNIRAPPGAVVAAPGPPIINVPIAMATWGRHRERWGYRVGAIWVSLLVIDV